MEVYNQENHRFQWSIVQPAMFDHRRVGKYSAYRCLCLQMFHIHHESRKKQKVQFEEENLLCRFPGKDWKSPKKDRSWMNSVCKVLEPSIMQAPCFQDDCESQNNHRFIQGAALTGDMINGFIIYPVVRRELRSQGYLFFIQIPY